MEVHPDELRAIAKKVGEAAKTAVAAHAVHADLLTPSVGAGWVAASGARSAAVAWGAFLRRLGASVAGLSADFTAAAERYETADAASADRLDRSRGRRE